MAQLSENFIFIYLGLSLFTATDLEYKPLFILISTVGICAARWCAVFPLSKVINGVSRYRAVRRGREATEELPFPHQIMLFWAGLRGAVGVALAAGLTGPNKSVLRATVLVVVVLTVIIFGGTMASMLEILGIRTGVVEEIDSDDEFDIEVVPGGGYARQSGKGFGHNPRRSTPNGFGLADVHNPRRGVSEGQGQSEQRGNTVYNSATPAGRPPNRPDVLRRSSSRPGNLDIAEQGLLSPVENGSGDEDEGNELDLPPDARRTNSRTRQPPSPSPRRTVTDPSSSAGPTASTSLRAAGGNPSPAPAPMGISSATGAISQLISDLSEDPAGAFSKIDEGFIKPHLLLDPGRSNNHHHHHGGGGGGSGASGV
jgi:sodium/hydrogen exchanger-like protein 6/7